MKVHWLKITDSTNNDALKNKEKEGDMTVWSAELQTAGRGQRGNKWKSRSGENLTFSILFKPENMDANAQFAISQVSAIGVADYLRDKCLDAKVKWPNDVYVGDKKICGMLIENILSGDKLAVSVSGIGININQREFPSDLPNPTSLVLEMERRVGKTGLSFDVKEELPKVLDKIFSLYSQVRNGLTRDDEVVTGRLNAQYESMLYRLGEYHYYEETDYCGEDRIGRIYGKIVGIDNKTARLRIELEDGRLREYFFKELKYII